MSGFKRLDRVSRLPRVFVRTLALDREHDLPVIAAEVTEYLMGFVVQTRFPLEGGGENGPNVVTAADLPRVFAGILDLPREERQKFAVAFNTILDGLHREDFFGTEGQRDPRGDRRG